MRHLKAALTDWQVLFIFLLFETKLDSMSSKIWLHILIYMSVVAPRQSLNFFFFFKIGL